MLISLPLVQHSKNKIPFEKLYMQAVMHTNSFEQLSFLSKELKNIYKNYSADRHIERQINYS